MATFDARPIIAAGGEPFDDIMAAVAALGQGEVPARLPSSPPAPVIPGNSR